MAFEKLVPSGMGSAVDRLRIQELYSDLQARRRQLPSGVVNWQLRNIPQEVLDALAAKERRAIALCRDIPGIEGWRGALYRAYEIVFRQVQAQVEAQIPETSEQNVDAEYVEKRDSLISLALTSYFMIHLNSSGSDEEDCPVNELLGELIHIIIGVSSTIEQMQQAPDSTINRSAEALQELPITCFVQTIKLFDSLHAIRLRENDPSRIELLEIPLGDLLARYHADNVPLVESIRCCASTLLTTLDEAHLLIAPYTWGRSNANSEQCDMDCVGGEADDTRRSSPVDRPLYMGTIECKFRAVRHGLCWR